MKSTPQTQAVAVCFALVALTACKPPAGSAPPTPKVTVTRIHTATVTNWDEFPGHLQAVESVEVRPRVSGYIASIHFEDGAQVRAGDPLFVIDPRPYQATADRALAQRQQAETRLELARNDLQRAAGLRAARAVSDEEWDQRGNAVREAEAALAAARAAESAARIDLEYTRITAPIDGRIGRRLVTPGNLVQGGGMVPGTLLTTLVKLDPMHGYFDANERSFARYRAHAAASPGGLPCELALAGDTGFPHAGRIDFFDNAVDASTGTIRIRGVFPNADHALVPGMFARIRIPAGPPAAAALVPAVAIGSDQGNKFVLVVNDQQVVEPRRVQVGAQHGAAREVQGLQPDDRVIINGLMMARPGARVDVVEAATEGGTSGAAPAASAAAR